MVVIMPSHAEARRHDNGDEHDRDYQTPASRLVQHFSARGFEARPTQKVV
jgi:hypothetical protein